MRRGLARVEVLLSLLLLLAVRLLLMRASLHTLPKAGWQVTRWRHAVGRRRLVVAETPGAAFVLDHVEALAANARNILIIRIV